MSISLSRFAVTFLALLSLVGLTFAGALYLITSRRVDPDPLLRPSSSGADSTRPAPSPTP